MGFKRIYITLIVFVLGGIIMYAQDTQITVSGTVTDERGVPIPGVSISVKNTTQGTTTDFDGNYELAVGKDEKLQLVFDHVSFIQEVIDFKEAENATKDVVLRDSENVLEETVVVGFARKRKEDLTGAVSQVGQEVFDSRPITKVDQALQGQVPGLNLGTDTGGELDGSLNIDIRGTGTIGEGSSSGPLVLIDGVEGDLNTVNPNDIESVSVLKDAAAASIYGSRAPFGVILITTKNGKSGKVQVSYSNSFRFEKPINVPARMNSLQFAHYVNDLFENSGRNHVFNNDRIQLIKDYMNGDLAFGTEPNNDGTAWVASRNAYGNEDWYDIHLKRHSFSQEHNLSISGGSEKVQYYTSLNYLEQDGVFRYGGENFNKLTVNNRLNFDVLENLNIELNTRFLRRQHDKPSAQNMRFYHNLSRMMPTSPLLSPFGEYMGNSLVQQLTEGGRKEDKTDFLYNSLKLTYEPVDDLKLHGDINTSLVNSRGTEHLASVFVTQPNGKEEPIPLFDGYPSNIETRANGIFAIPRPGQSYYQVNNGEDNYIDINFRGDYAMNIGEHNFNFILGTQMEHFSSRLSQLGTDGIESDDRPFISQDGSKFVFERKGAWSNFGVFGRINYDYKKKYLLEANFRADGASRFPRQDRWGYFPSFSGGWNIAKEEFFNRNDVLGSTFSELKLRASWGILGNQNTNSFYPYFQQMNFSNGNWIVDGSVPSTLFTPQPFSTSITWEKVSSLNFGLDIAAFNNRLTSTLDIFERRTKDMIGPSTVRPATFGAVVPKTNNAELKTKGWELSLGWKDNIGSDFTYGVNLILSDNKTSVTKYNNPDGLIRLNGVDQFYEGKLLGEIWGYESAGIAKSDKEMGSWLEGNKPDFGSDWAGGDMMYKDLNGDGVINSGANKLDDKGDLKRIGNSNPRYRYGVNVNMKYKDFDFSFFIQGIGKRDVLMQGSGFYPGMHEFQLSPYSKFLDYFRAYGAELGENIESYYPRPFIGDKNYQPQTHFLQNAAYLRLKNIQLGYTFPKKVTNHVKMSSLRIFVSGENIYTYSKLRMYDPEGLADLINGSGKTYPMRATYSFGLRATF